MNFKHLQTDQKLRGGYYTPDYLARFLTQWAVGNGVNSILEPSCGDGIFIEQVAAIDSNIRVVGFEIDREEANKSAERGAVHGLTDHTTYNRDFLSWGIHALQNESSRFDAVLGNPPFIRYQYLPVDFQGNAEAIFKQLGCKFTKHTNAWVPFILASFALLRPGGRLAMVVPAEIIHIGHANSLRSYLYQHARKIIVIDPEELWFPDTLQGTVLLLVEKKLSPSDKAQGLSIYSVQGREFLDVDIESLSEEPCILNGEAIDGKWTRALLNPTVQGILNGMAEHHSVHRLGDIATVDVGIVTGANKFFLVDNKTIRDYSLMQWAHPMFGRSEHCPGIIYDAEQHRINAANGKPTNFVYFQSAEVEQYANARAYIRKGEAQQLLSRYKCRIRDPWYVVPSVYTTEVSMLKRSHHAPRLIANKLRAYTTDTAYRIRVHSGTADQLVFCFMNALTALTAEIEGRHYGGGVLELVPSEIERLLVPLPPVEPDIAGLDQMVRTLSVDTVLERQTHVICEALGLPKLDQVRLLDNWKRLRNRRQRITQNSISLSQ